MKVLEIAADGTKTAREMTAAEQEAFWREPEVSENAPSQADMQTALSEFAATLADPGTNSIAKIRAAAQTFLDRTGGDA